MQTANSPESDWSSGWWGFHARTDQSGSRAAGQSDKTTDGRSRATRDRMEELLQDDVDAGLGIVEDGLATR
jgi:hypothetical protein